MFGRARVHNPLHHRRYRRRHYRRRNPFGGVSGGQVFDFAIGGLGLAIFQPMVNRFIGGILPLGQFNGPVITAISGWGLGQIFNLFTATKKFSQPAMILGFSTAVIQIVQPYVSNIIGGLGGAATPPAPMMHGWPQGYSGWNAQRIGAMRRRGRPIRGIGVTTGIPPTITPPPMPPAPAQPATGAMQGFGVRPGVWAH